MIIVIAIIVIGIIINTKLTIIYVHFVLALITGRSSNASSTFSKTEKRPRKTFMMKTNK